MAEVLQPRAEEMCHLVWDEIHRAGYEKSLNSGIVLTGGGANLGGMVEIAEQIFDMPVRRGAPAGLGGLADHVGNPSFATAVGLLLRAHRENARSARGRARGSPAPAPSARQRAPHRAGGAESPPPGLVPPAGPKGAKAARRSRPGFPRIEWPLPGFRRDWRDPSSDLARPIRA